MAQVQTISGPVEDDQLGRTLGHEHITVLTDAVTAQFPHLYDHDELHRRAITAVTGAMEHGVKTLVDPAVMDVGRDIRFSQRVVEETGIQVVPATGVYGEHYTFLAHPFQQRPVEYLADAFVHDIEEGIQGTDVRAAFIKTAIDEPGITEDMDKALRAAAQAHKRTGAPILVHSHPGTRRGLEIMDVFDSEDVDPARVQVAHTGDTDDLEYIEELLARGPFIGMDRYGLEFILATDKRNRTLVELCRRGYAERMTLSHDFCAAFDWYPDEAIAELAPEWSMSFIFEKVIPSLLEAGVEQTDIDTMLDVSSRRWLVGD